MTGADIDNFQTSAPVDLVLTSQRAELLHILWTSWCNGGDTRVDVRGFLSRYGEIDPFVIAGPSFVVNRPACRDPNAIGQTYGFTVVPAAASSYAADLGPDPLDAVYCYVAGQPKWLKPCDIVDRLALPFLTGNVDAVIGWVETKTYVCPEPGTGGIGGPSYLCEGAQAGEVREGVPVAFHGSGGDVMSPEQLRATLEEMVAGSRAEDGLSRTRPATVACLSSTGCTEFAIGVAIDGPRPAAYLVFRTEGEAVRLTSVGFAGENALIIRRGGEMGIGGVQARFIPIVPPY